MQGEIFSGRYYLWEVNMVKVTKVPAIQVRGCRNTMWCGLLPDWGPLFQVPRTHPPFLGEKSLALQPPAPASSALPGPGPRLQSPSVPESCPLSPCSPCLRAPAMEFPPACRMSAPQPPPCWRLLHPVLRLGNQWAGAARPAWFQNKYCFII